MIIPNLLKIHLQTKWLTTNVGDILKLIVSISKKTSVFQLVANKKLRELYACSDNYRRLDSIENWMPVPITIDRAY